MNRRGDPGAIAKIHGDGGLCGTVQFYPRPGGTLVVARICNLPENDSGFHGFHIHEGRDCGGDGYADTGGHYNPGKTPHPRHAGDLPPLLSCGGFAFMKVFTDRFQVCDVIGRTVVIHSRCDDFRTQPAGDAGTKIGCGEIRRA